MNRPPEPLKVVYNVRHSGEAFRVDRQFRSSRRWHPLGSFRTLTLALRNYPAAEAEELAVKQQEFLENNPHPFRPTFGLDECWTCTKPQDWLAHHLAAGGAR